MNDIVLAKVIDLQQMVTEVTDGAVNSNVVTDSSNAPKIKNVFYNFFLATLYAAGVGAVLVLIYGGFLYITAGGDGDKAEKGKKTIVGAIIGIIIISASLVSYNYILDKLK